MGFSPGCQYLFGEFLLYADRRRLTYSSWPHDKALKGSTSANTAAAGFVSTVPSKAAGTPATAACVFCGLEQTFEDDDDPWKIHREKAPSCEFVNIYKKDESTWTDWERLRLLAICYGYKFNIFTRKLIPMKENGEEAKVKTEAVEEAVKMPGAAEGDSARDTTNIPNLGKIREEHDELAALVKQGPFGTEGGFGNED